MAEQTPSQGQLLGQYELLVPIARGGMGQIWAARLRGGRGFQKLVALKTILPLAQDLPRVEHMLQQEAKLAALVQHPNVVQTIDLGEDAGTLYLVMEWVDGEPLHRIMKRAAEVEPIPLNIAVSWIAQACRGLHAAHEARDDEGELVGLVHRDVSPQNILITDSGTAKLFDFGIAKAMNHEASLTEVGEIKGKFSYMAPEQLLGQVVDRRADLFAMGIVLYWLTVGRHPFRDDNPGEAVLGITKAEPAPPPSRFVANYPRALEQVVLRALEKSPDKRFETAEQMSVALQKALPQAFALGMDVETEKYLRRLVGDRAQSRRSLLRTAQEHLDSQRPVSAESVGSLKAIVVDAPRAQSTGTRPRPALTPASGVERLAAPAPSRRRPASGMRKFVVAAAVLPVLLASSVWLRSAWRAAPASAGGSLPPAAQELSPPRLPAPPALAPSVAEPQASVVPPAPPLLSPSPEPAARARSKPRAGQAKASRPASKQTPIEAKRHDGRDVGLLPPDYAETPR